MSIIKVRDINEETQNVQAQILAYQIKTVESATNAYLVLKYNDISTLSSTSATCNSGNSTCNITLDTVLTNLIKPDHERIKQVVLI